METVFEDQIQAMKEASELQQSTHASELEHLNQALRQATDVAESYSDRLVQLTQSYHSTRQELKDAQATIVTLEAQMDSVRAEGNTLARGLKEAHEAENQMNAQIRGLHAALEDSQRQSALLSDELEEVYERNNDYILVTKSLHDQMQKQAQQIKCKDLRIEELEAQLRKLSSLTAMIHSLSRGVESLPSEPDGKDGQSAQDAKVAEAPEPTPSGAQIFEGQPSDSSPTELAPPATPSKSYSSPVVGISPVNLAIQTSREHDSAETKTIPGKGANNSGQLHKADSVDTDAVMKQCVATDDVHNSADCPITG